MKALVKKEAGPGLWLEEISEPTVGPNDVLIRVVKTSICGTDLHIYNWDEWASKTIKAPMAIGHEFVGRVEAVGSSVSDFQPGQLVSAEGHLVCGHCRNCMAGRRHLCANVQGLGVNRPGAFAEFVSIPASNVWAADPSLPLDLLSCFDPLGNATHTANTFKVVGEDVLITGAGPIGLMAAAIVKHIGARYIVVSDPNPFRLDLAKRMGATAAVNPNEKKLKDVQKELGMKEGFDVGMEMSGNPAALASMIENMGHGGKIAALGIPSGPMEVDWTKLIFNMLSIQGIYGREMFETWYLMTSMLKSGLDISPVITHHFHFTEFEKAFATIREGNCGKVILEWG